MDNVQNFVAWETMLISLSVIIEQILQLLTNGVNELDGIATHSF